MFQLKSTFILQSPDGNNNGELLRTAAAVKKWLSSESVSADCECESTAIFKCDRECHLKSARHYCIPSADDASHIPISSIFQMQRERRHAKHWRPCIEYESARWSCFSQPSSTSTICRRHVFLFFLFSLVRVVRATSPKQAKQLVWLLNFHSTTFRRWTAWASEFEPFIFLCHLDIMTWTTIQFQFAQYRRRSHHHRRHYNQTRLNEIRVSCSSCRKLSSG